MDVGVCSDGINHLWWNFETAFVNPVFQKAVQTLAVPYLARCTLCTAPGKMWGQRWGPPLG